MKRFFFASLVLSLFIFSSCTKKREGQPKLLIFAKTMGYKHKSIPAGIKAIEKLGAENNFSVDTTTNAAMFTDEELKKYSVVVFLSTTGSVLDYQQEAAFERYIQSGGGYVGIHAATDTEYDWGWYGKLVGAYFQNHPRGTPEANFIVTDKNFAATSFFTDSIWKRTDELYDFDKFNPNVNVVVTVDESTYEGGSMGDFHPMSWYHEYDGGRSFYTAGGHTDESFSEELFLKHLLGGIQYAIGENLVLDYDKATTQIPPDMDRFSKTPLLTGTFYEPTEMTILPNNDVLIAQRRGEILHYSAETGEVNQVALLDVYHKVLEAEGVNAEEGLMGLQKDPDFATNNWVYAFYAPTGDAWVNRLSRFKFKDNVFDLKSEQIILDVDSQREICCHTGGSIAFGPDKLLYLSTGDNTTPFNEKGVEYVSKGYGPLNDIPGHEQYDARRSSANTNDLRGKILRIKMNEDGSYDIPEGNLFPEGMEKTRPEIYTMGHRNPYRISVDPKKGYVYWGDVGPDAREDDMKMRGPRGYDEMNQARKAGNFGWPLFIGDNKPYVAYDYETGESGEAFDPEKPINNSRNNTGLTELPPAMPAYAFYPYAETKYFPQVATGGRNAMAGPTYYADMYEEHVSLPEHYNEKVIIYDWIRGWMKAVTLFEDGSFNKMEPFASDVKVNNLIDMEMGPDGRLYLLEYGAGWFSQNHDSGLSYIEFNGGNRPPVIDSLTIDKTSGKLPLTIAAEVASFDKENDGIRYVWDFGNGETKETEVASVSYTYEKSGQYKMSVIARDTEGAEKQSETIAINAGNSKPEVVIIVNDKTTEFSAGVPIAYEVKVTDPDGENTVDSSNIFIAVDYLESMDEVGRSVGHQQISSLVSGKALTQNLDCKTCHKEKEASIGPSYFEVSEKYKNVKRAHSYLQSRIILGGGGVWGEVIMPAHPDLTKSEARQIVSYIQSLSNTGRKKEKSLPLKGTIVPKPEQGDKVMVLTASYTDNGEGGSQPLSAISSVRLQRSMD
ncbi:MAG: ThuA domain-containing protein [Flavobacteriaceae bacterium]